MKKTYIEPKNTVVALKVRDNVLQSGSIHTTNVEGLDNGGNSSDAGIYEAGGRENISAPDVWEEW
ncbi:MAG: hypothetical protein IKP30_00500 [Bacteroidaceae bacterium]|nr:hypothetical protein [Bacteroidaceae bacterium]